MDPYASYHYSSNFEPGRLQRPNPHQPTSDTLFSQQQRQQQQQQQLPPFREILAAHITSATESATLTDPLSTVQSGTMTRATFQHPPVPSRSEPPSPEQSLPGNSADAFDNMSARSGESTYTQRNYHQRQNSSWNSTPQYPDNMSPYNTQQRGVPCPPQGSYSSSRTSPNLPPIRDIDRFNNYDTSYPLPASSYPQPYGTSAGSPTGQESFSFSGDRPSYYDASHRYGQTYAQNNRPSAPQLDYPRYQPSPYDYRSGVPYQSPYGSVDYAASPTSMHHPSSPTVAIDPDNRNRKRRGNLPKQVTDILRQWFHAHLEHPYPTEEDKQAFMNRTGLTNAQINNWFINARRRHWPALRHAARERGAQSSTTDYDSDQVRRQQSDATMR